MSAKKENRGIVSFECGSGNTMEVIFPNVIPANEVKDISVINSSGEKVEYKKTYTGGNGYMNAGEEYIYYVKNFEKNDAEYIETDKEDVNWICYIKDKRFYKKNKADKFFTLEDISQDDAESDFLNKSTSEDETKKNEDDFNVIKNKGILYAKKEVAEITVKNGDKEEKINASILRIKFSKWLEGVQIQIEARIDTKTYVKNSSGNNVCSRFVKATPEISEVYWTNKDGERIEKTGYSEEIYMHVVSLGLKNKTIDGLLLEKDHDTDTSMSPKGDRIEWKNNQFKVEERDFKRQFKIGAKEQYKDAREEDVENDLSFNVSVNDNKKKDSEERKEENEELELFFEVSNATKLKLEESKKYGSLIITTENNITDAYFAKVENEKMVLDAPLAKGNKNQKGNVEQHEKLTEGVIGQKVKLVAECDNIENDKKIILQLFEKEALLTDADTALQVVQNGKETNEIIAEVKDGYAVVEIELSKYDSATYKNWDSKLDPDNGDEKTSTIFIKAKEEQDGVAKNFLEDEEFKLTPAITIYEIYHNHKIYKTTRPNAKKGKYFYINTSDEKHLIFKTDYRKIKSKYTSAFYGGKEVNLIDLRKYKSYNKNGIKFAFDMKANDNRPWIYQDTFASLIGAFINVGYEDLFCTGFSKKDGSPGVSTSHKNGFNGDFRYLKKDKTSSPMSLKKKKTSDGISGWEDLDVTRQEKLINAFYNYGWKSFLSHKYGDKNSIKLKKTSHDTKHDDHLHLQGYDRTFIKDK